MNRESAQRMAFDLLARRQVGGPTKELLLLVADLTDLFMLLPDNIHPLRSAASTGRNHE